MEVGGGRWEEGEEASRRREVENRNGVESRGCELQVYLAAVVDRLTQKTGNDSISPLFIRAWALMQAGGVETFLCKDRCVKHFLSHLKPSLNSPHPKPHGNGEYFERVSLL